MAKTMEFKGLRESIAAHLEALQAPGVKETAEVSNARKLMQEILVAATGVCTTMTIEIEDDQGEDEDNDDNDDNDNDEDNSTYDNQ